MPSKVTFVKVGVDDVEVQALSKVTGQSASAIASAINADRYRKAYNRVKMEEVKVLRRLIKEHPELLAQVKEVK